MKEVDNATPCHRTGSGTTYARHSNPDVSTFKERKTKDKEKKRKKKRKQRKQKPLKKQYEQQGKTKDVHKTRAHLHGPKYSKELNKQTF